MKVLYQGLFAQRSKRNPTVVVDFDGTIAADAFPSIGDPEPGVREALGSLRDAGFEIVVYSCRLNRGDGRPLGEVEKHHAMMVDWLRENAIPYDKIDMGYDGKPRADFYVDNKAMHYGGGDDWERIAGNILSSPRGER